MAGHFVRSLHVSHYDILARMENNAHVATVCDALRGRVFFVPDRHFSNTPPPTSAIMRHSYYGVTLIVSQRHLKPLIA
jgi:hypothetical protein